MFSMAADSWRPNSSARSRRANSPPASTRTPSKVKVPSARRQPRSGTVTVAVAVPSVGGSSAWDRRMADAAGEPPSAAASRGAPAPVPRTGRRRRGARGGGSDARASRHVLEFGRSAQDKVTISPVVDPNGGSVGAEQLGGSAAEGIEPGRQIQRGSQHGRKLVQQRTNVPL